MVFPHFLTPIETAFFLHVKPASIYRWMHGYHVPWYLFGQRCPRLAKVDLARLTHPETSTATPKGPQDDPFAVHATLWMPAIMTLTQAHVLLTVSRATADRLCRDHYGADVPALKCFELPGPHSHLRIAAPDLREFIQQSKVIEPAKIDPRAETF